MTYPPEQAIVRIQDAVAEMMEGTMQTHFKIGLEYAEYEPVTWLIYQLAGGHVDPNSNSSQIEPVLGKSNVRLVTESDFAKIAHYTGMTTATFDRLCTDGLYKYGKEVSALMQYAYAE